MSSENLMVAIPSEHHAGGCCAAGDSMRLSLEAPVTQWDEGIPLGNGLMGG
jgi:hypothetical protein